MAVIARQLRLRFDQSVERSGLTRAKWTLIATVAHNPGATQCLIAEKLEVREVTAGRLIDRLCDEGYLERHPNPNDRRAYRVDLTAAAQPVLEKIDEIARNYEREVFAGFGDEDLDKLNALLEAIAGNLSAGLSRYHEHKK